jgi:4'-phosphopantetheinyl transferase
VSLVPTLPPAGTVDVWRIPLDVPETLLRWVTASLDEDERRMRDRMRVGAERWAVARGARREILAGCIGGEATAVRFEVAANGKPRLVGETRVRFNGSARGGLALLAIAFDRELGVDVEQDDMPGDLSAVARQFLLPRERAEIEAAHPEERTRRFAMAWTRHEAARKLRGLGLDAPLPDGETNAAIRDVPVPVGFVASVTAEGTDWTLRVRDVSELLPES